MPYFEYVKELLLKIINVILPKQKKAVSVTDSLYGILIIETKHRNYEKFHLFDSFTRRMRQRIC